MALSGRNLGTLLFLLGLWTSVPLAENAKFDLKRGINGGMSCAVCTVFISLVEQIAEVNNRSIVEYEQASCFYLPDKFREACFYAFDAIGPSVIELIAEKLGPDVTCQSLGLCYTPPGNQRCSLYPQKDSHWDLIEKRRLKHTAHFRKRGLSIGDYTVCDIPGVRELCQLFGVVLFNHTVGVDKDGDGFSVFTSMRGSSWKGRDCNDERVDIYPGRKPLDRDALHDTNCNGISGWSSQHGMSYEELLCNNTRPVGVAVVGDSVGAHFHAPVQWFDPTQFSLASLHDLPFALGNELDWPQLSAVTGYANVSWSVISGPTDSLYKRMAQRNLCMHRDYQNVAVNGDDIFEVGDFVKHLFRDPVRDHPMFVVVELIGNDVCNNNPNTLANMTTEAEMKVGFSRLMRTLEKKLPNGSHVLVIGMADGDFIYQFLKDRIHPLGNWRKDLTYPQVYDWWNCMQVTPCMGWLNRNDTLRNLTTQRAMKLSKVMERVVASNKYSSFEAHYIDCPMMPLIRQWVIDHGPGTGWQLIEPVDGFHPNQQTQALFAKYLWKYMEDTVPQFINPLNKNNAEIRRLFGDQGGF